MFSYWIIYLKRFFKYNIHYKKPCFFQVPEMNIIIFTVMVNTY